MPHHGSTTVSGDQSTPRDEEHHMLERLIASGRRRPRATGRRATNWFVRASVFAGLLVSSVIVTGAGQPVSGETGVTTRYVPVEPFRLTDTRIGVGFERVDATTIRVQVAGIDRLPDDAEAVAVSIAATGASSTGFVIGYPADTDRQLASQINYSPGHTVSTGAVIPLSAGGAFEVYSRTAVDIVIDVTGSFVAASTSRAGRFEPIPPTRALDTRDTAPIRAGGTTTIFLPESVAGDATGALVTLTSTAPNQPGHYTAFTGTQRPVTATLNVSRANSTRGTTAIVPVKDRQIKIYSSGGGHLIVDVVGWFTGPLSAESDDGLFVPTPATRLLDTRDSAPLIPGEARAFDTPTVRAVLGAVTMFNASVRGHGSLYANGTGRPPTSSINIMDTPVITNLAVSRTTKAGISLYTNTTSHFVYDQFGYFTGTPAPIDRPLDDKRPDLPWPAPEQGCVVTDILVPTCGVWFGASTPNRDRRNGWDYTTGLAEYEAVAGNTPDILHFYKNGPQRFPSAEEIAQAQRPGRQRSLLQYNWKPSSRHDWADVAAGAADDEIAVIARSIKAYPHKLFLTIHHEPEDEVGRKGSPAEYAAMFRHVVTELRAHGVTNAVFVWNVMGYEGWERYLDGLYPGDGFVDWICYDPYAKRDIHPDLEEIVNRPRPDLGWPGFYQWARAKAPTKPLMLCEWGVDTLSNSDPASIISVDPAAQLGRYPMLKAIVYWNDIDDKVNTRIDLDTPKSRALGAAYRKLAANPIFNAMKPDAAP
jgi:hypothetical protein